MSSAPARLEDTLKSGKFVLTAEITPPVSCDKNDLLEKALPLRGLANAVNVTDGAGARAHMDSVTAATLLLMNGIEPILQLTCRDRNRLGLQGALMGAAAMGVRNLLALRGDDPTQGDQPETKPVFDLDARGLLATAARMRDAGELPSGKKIGGKADFFLGAADAPIDPAPDWKPAGLKGKVEGGARFAQTQFCMDSGVLRRYTQRLTEEGVLPGLSMIIGVPLGEVGALDQGEAVRLGRAGCDDRPHGGGRRSGRRGQGDPHRLSARDFGDPRRRRRAYHGTDE